MKMKENTKIFLAIATLAIVYSIGYRIIYLNFKDEK